MACYQLGCRQGRSHCFFVYFDNAAADRTRRFTVTVSIRTLPAQELRDAQRAIIEAHGIEALGRRPGAGLEFFKYVAVRHGLAPPRIFDLDTLKEVTYTTKKACLTGTLPPVESDTGGTAEAVPLTYGAAIHQGVPTVDTRTLVFRTKTHGRVTLRLSRYGDPDVRSGLDIKVGRNVKKSTCWGAGVYPVNPALVELKTLRAVPRAVDPAAVNRGGYFVEETGFMKTDGSTVETSMLVPASKVGQYRIDIG